jgi:2-dehydro-3-deoxygalactonokinase
MTAEWVAVDWGTSNVRAWGITSENEVAFTAASDKGMSRLARDAFPAALDDLIGTHVTGPLEVVICGMAGARQGWLEAPYLETPANLNELSRGAVRPQGADLRLAPRILPGVCQRADGREDVMRGEETQLLGLLHLHAGFSGAAVLPGTHSKWVEIRDGHIVRFETAMTGELYELLARHSVLRHSLVGDLDGPARDQGIAEGLEAGLANPELLTSRVFRARSAALLSGKGADWCSGYLSGLLIGSEVAGHRDWLGDGAVPLIGSAHLSRLYAAALERIGRQSFAIDAADATIAGLKEARAQ